MTIKNPYRPGAGRRPPVLTGRDSLIGVISDEVQRITDEGFGDRPFVIWGLRGIGKTAVLNHIVDTVDQMGWFTISVEARPDENLATQIGQEMATILRRYRTSDEIARSVIRRALGVLKSFQLKFDPTGAIALSADVEPREGYADSGNQQLDFQDLLESIGETARDLGIGVLVAVDELQEASESDLAAINRTLHKMGQKPEPVPVLFVGAGLPTLPSVLSKATSYAERLYRYFEIGLLADEDMRLAVGLPARELGVEWSDEAMELVLEASKGYPYFVQQCGSSTWNDRLEDDRITLDDAKVGVISARGEVDRGLYRARWDRATPTERKFMVAMAQAGEPAPISDVLRLMGKKSHGEVSTIREKLIHDGQVYSPSRGRLAFTVPGMGDYILRMHADEAFPSAIREVGN